MNSKDKKEYNKKWREKNPNYRKEYFLKNKQQEKMKQKEWAKKHPEKTKAFRKKWGERNKVRLRENLRKFRDSHPNYYKEWHKNNLVRERKRGRISENKRRALKKKVGGSFTWEEWEEKKKEFGYKCAICGISEVELLNKTGMGLTVDHIIPLNKSGLNLIFNIQPLCLSCNARKGDRIIK